MAKKKSRIYIGAVVTMKGKKYKISAGTAKGKKYKATPIDGGSGVVQFGAKGFKVGPVTDRGDSYCARSAGIKMTDLELKKSLLTCPGDTIQEHIDHIGMSQAELAERLGRSIPKLNELIKGKAPITKETATKLEFVLGVPANFWLNLERTYQDELLEL